MKCQLLFYGLHISSQYGLASYTYLVIFAYLEVKNSKYKHYIMHWITVLSIIDQYDL